MAKQVFYDPRQARWRRIRRLFDIAAITISGLIVFFIYSAVRNEPLPELLLPLQKRPYHAFSKNEKDRAKEKHHKAQEAALRSHRRTKSPPSLVKLNQEEGIRAAFYVPWDAASFSALKEYSHQLDLLYPEWLHMLTPDGRLQSVDEETFKFFDVVQGSTVHSVDSRVMPFLKSEDANANIEVFPLVNNFDGANWLDITAFFSDPDARAHFRDQIATFLASDKYRGLMVDFEDFQAKGYPGYLALLNEIGADLHEKGMKLYVSVPAGNEDFPYGPVAAAADGVVIMNYDEHDPEHDPGPVASQDFFVQNLQWLPKVLLSSSSKERQFQV